MSTKNNLFSDLLSSILFPSDDVDLLDLTESFLNNVSVDYDGNVCSIEVKENMDDKNYSDCIDSLLSIASNVRKMFIEDGGKFDLTIKVGDRQPAMYSYDQEKDGFVEVYGEEDVKSNVETKSESLDNDCDLNDLTGSPMTFAQSLCRDIQRKHEIDYKFDVDHAIKELERIWMTDDYELIYSDVNNNVINGIIVPIETLNNDMIPSEEFIDFFVANGNKSISEFINKCVSELGFSDVVAHIHEMNIQGCESYATIVFHMYF